MWRKWRIYCPSYRVEHLFSEASLYEPEEQFVPPCSLNETNCGANSGKPRRIAMIGTVYDARLAD